MPWRDGGLDRFRLIGDIRLEYSERLLSTQSGRSLKSGFRVFKGINSSYLAVIGAEDYE
jgi:hypothetical protein